MSEIKRVSLTSLEPQKVSDKVAKKPPKTVRISVNLSESTEDKCPEYNYKDELAAVKKKSKHVKNNDVVPNGLDPFGENDDDVRRIALEMEEKYGGGPGTKKKRKGRKDDYADIGMGYDESDSFIDNTDGYDEIIPQNVTTLHGGFYINCGALEFKTDDEASSNISSSSEESADEGDEDDENPKSPQNANVNRKRILETSDEDENSNKSDSQDGKKIKLEAKTSIQQAIKKKLFSPNKIQVKKKRPIDPLKKTVKELLREKRKDLDLSVASELKDDESIMEKDPLKENKRPMNASSVSDAIESVVKATIGEKKPASLGYDNNGNKQQNSDVNNVKESANNDQPQSTEGESSRDSTKLENVEIVKLPENLPADISQIIDNLKAIAEKKQSDAKDGKSKFFTEDVNEMLLKLEKKCRCLGKPSKTKIYEHLAPFAKCKKETLIRRAKNLVLSDEEKRLKRYMKLLKDAVERSMPELLKNFEMDSNKIFQKRLLLDADSEEYKMLKMPKRRYQWTEETRKIMRDIIFTKKRCLLLEGKSKENYEDLLMQFFKSDLQVLWPEGWMSMSIMKKLYISLNDAKKLDSSHDSSINKHSSATNSHADTNTTNVSIIPITNSSESNSKKAEKNHVVANDVTVNKLDNVNAISSAATSQKTFESSNSKNESKKKEEKQVKEKSFDIKSLIDDGKKYKEKHKHEKNDKDNSNSVIIVNSKKHKDEPKRKSPVLEVKEKEDASVSGNASNSAAVIEASHCQIIDLTETDSPVKLPKTSKSRPEATERPLKLTKDKSSSHSDNHSSKEYHMEYLDIKKKSKSKHRDERSDRNEHKIDRSDRIQFDVNKLTSNNMEITVTPSFFNSVTCPANSEIRNSDGDDIQKVMENLKALQKLSSPIKSETSSPVSVIAYNKSNSSQGSVSTTTQQQRNNEYSASFQDEFQKQILNYITPNSSKTNYRCS